MVKIIRRDNESQQKLFQRFRKTASMSGIFQEVRKRRWFVSKTEQRRLAKKKAIRRQKRQQRKNYSGRNRR
ncbi:MAG: 30S ribosomal protein S21 [Aliifodinibius sp.]|nr:30S ribosomal protein S21 [Fodinibius sp.]